MGLRRREAGSVARGDRGTRARSGAVVVRPGGTAGRGTAGRGRHAPGLAAWTAALFLAVITAPLAARALDVDGPTPLPQLLAFLPWFLAPGWLALAYAALARRWLLCGWAAAALAATGWFLQPYGADAPEGSAERPAEARFRVLTANLEHGGATRSLVETLRDERPQLVSVQECNPRCARALRTAELRDLYPHRVVAASDGAGGSALLSRFPLDGKTSLEGSRMAMPGAVVRIGESRVRVRVVHPMPPDVGETAVWKRELGMLRRLADRPHGEPLLMAGDFNSSQDHAAFRAVLDTGLDDAARQAGRSRTPTWPTATAPPLGAQIDHVLLGDRMVAIGADFLDLPGTDHRALVADVKLFAPDEEHGD